MLGDPARRVDIGRALELLGAERSLVDEVARAIV